MKNGLLTLGNAISKQIVKIPEKGRNVIMYICLAVLNVSCYVYVLDAYFGYTVPAMVNAGLGTLMFAIIVLIGMDRVYTEDVFDKNWIVQLFLCICGIMIVISGFMHDIGYSYIAMGLLMTFVMPVYCLVWGDKEHLTKLFTALARVTVLFFIVFFLLHVFITPRSASEFYMDGRYMGMCSNPNGMAKIPVTAYVGALYLICTGKTKKKYLYAIIMGMSMSMLLMTASRANFLAVCALTFFTLWISVKNAWKDTAKLKSLAIGIIVIAIVAGAMIPVSQKCLEWKSDTLAQEQTGETTVEKKSMTDRMSQGQEGQEGTLAQDVTSGRIELWLYVIKNAKFMGVDRHELVINSHNSIVEYLRRSGWIAGISFFVVELLSAIWILITVFSRRKVEDYEKFAVMGITAFGIVSLLDIVDLPFAKFITTIFYLCFAAMCVKRKSTKS